MLHLRPFALIILGYAPVYPLKSCSVFAQLRATQSAYVLRTCSVSTMQNYGPHSCPESLVNQYNNNYPTRYYGIFYLHSRGVSCIVLLGSALLSMVTLMYANIIIIAAHICVNMNSRVVSSMV